MESFKIKKVEVPFSTRLLELGQCAKFFISKDRQTYATYPATGTATPIYSQPFYRWLMSASEIRLGVVPSPQQMGRALSELDGQTRTAANVEAVYVRTAKLGNKNYQIDLGHDNHQTVELTGKQWTVAEDFNVPFQRLQTFDPFPIPEPTIAKLPVYLEQMYEISEKDAHKLSHWMAQAMLPEQKPPILVITGEARYDAVTQIRQHIDPCFHSIMNLPLNGNDLGQQAVENRVLAYSSDHPLSEKKIIDFKAMRVGMHARFREINPKDNILLATVHRPIIIASELKQEICRQQITIEINICRPVDHAEILGPLLDVVVQIIGQPTIYPKPVSMKVRAAESQPEVPEQPNTS